MERKPSNRSVHYEEDQKRDTLRRSESPKKPDLTSKPSFKSGIPVRGSTFNRSISETSVSVFLNYEKYTCTVTGSTSTKCQI